MYEPQATYSLKQYWKMVELDPDHAYEYARGFIRMMSGGSPAHGEIAVNIASLLKVGLRGSECHVYSSDVKVELSYNYVYLPDVSVSCDPADWTRPRAIESPTLVVEVLSPTTEQKDRLEKLAAYLQYPTIQEILYVDSRRFYIEHHHRIGVTKWEVSYYTHKEDVIDLASLEVTFTAGEVYDQVYLADEEQG